MPQWRQEAAENRFWQKKGCGSERNPTVVAGAREGHRGQAQIAKDRGEAEKIGMLVQR